MNEYDSLLAGKILEQNAVQTQSAEEADVILLNTCAIRENAHQTVYNRLKELGHLHKGGAKIGILGCMAQNLREDLLYENLPIDFIMGPDALPWDAVVKGLMIGSTIMVGSVLARRFVLKLDAQRFRLMIEGLLLVAGGTMLWAAWRHG